jgi:hypothetical protein
MGNRKVLKALILGIGCVTLLASTFAFGAVKPTKPDAPDKKAILQKAVKLQIPFIENQGQIPDESVRFYAKTSQEERDMILQWTAAETFM